MIFSVCLLQPADVLKLQNLLIIFHLLSDKQQFPVSKWSSIRYIQPKVEGIMFSQQVPGIMEYFFFSSFALLFQRQWGLLLLEPPLFSSYFFLFYYLDFVFCNQMVWGCLPSYLPPHHLRFIIISIIVNGWKYTNRTWKIQKCEFIDIFLSFILFVFLWPCYMYVPGCSPSHIILV